MLPAIKESITGLPIYGSPYAFMPRSGATNAQDGRPEERLNKMFGWIIDRSEVGRPGEFANLTDEQLDGAIMECWIERGMSERQARALLAAGRDKAGGSGH